jgi:hypothetical protein
MPIMGRPIALLPKQRRCAFASISLAGMKNAWPEAYYLRPFERPGRRDGKSSRAAAARFDVRRAHPKWPTRLNGQCKVR